MTSSIFHREIQHFRAFSMVHSTLSPGFSGFPQRHGRHGRRRHRRGSHHRGGRRDGGGDGGGSATGAGTAWADWNGKIYGLYIDYPIYYGTVTIYWNGLINGINHLL